jgi:curved DNA-binding protein CbpA
VARSYYDLLGVEPDADAERVRTAYRERVKDVHPDVSDRPDAADRFRRLTAAKETLCDPDERARYDRLGHERYVASAGTAGTAETTNTADATDADPGADRTGGTASDGAPDGHGGRGAERGADREARREARRRADAWSADAGRTSADGGTAQRGRHAASNRSRSWYQQGAGDGSGYRVSTSSEVGVQFTAGRVLFAVAVFFCYPLLLGVAVLPAFGTGVRVAAGVLALAVVVNTLSVPESAVLVFGVLTLAAPFALSAGGVGLLSVTGALAWAFCWVPFVIGGANLFALRA